MNASLRKEVRLLRILHYICPMFRRSSTTQSVSSAIDNGLSIQKVSTTYMSISNSQNPILKRSVSNTTTTASDRKNQDFNTDDLFTKHTILEIKATQNRLRWKHCLYTDIRIGDDLVCRTDADAKKEELRQMVGCVLCENDYYNLALICSLFDESVVNAIEIYYKPRLL